MSVLRRLTFPAWLAALACAAVVAVGAAAGAQTAPPSAGTVVGGEATFGAGALVGKPAPAFTVTGLDGAPVTLESLRGKTVVINAWATWCPPCRLETPALTGAYAALHGPGVVFLGIDSTEQAGIVRAFVAAKRVAFAQAIDADKSFARAYGVVSIPTTIVIDPRGIVRAVREDEIVSSQLTAFVAAAKAGRNANAASPLQTRVLALLGPAKFTFGAADAQTVRKQVKLATDAVQRADELVAAESPKGGYVDASAMNAAQAELLERSAAALDGVPQDDEVRALASRLRGDAARDRRENAAAASAYEAALAIVPDDPAALEGLASAASALKDRRTEIYALQRLVALDPQPAVPLVSLGLAYSADGDIPNAELTLRTAVAAAQAALAERGGAAGVRRLAWVHMYFGRVEAKAGKRDAAREQFALAAATAQRLPKTDERYAMYLEQAQEATVALDLGDPASAQTAVSLAPWTGAELPGSIPNTIKYRLVVSGRAGKHVALRAFDVPKGWVASFCTDRVCAPFKTAVVLPTSGVKIVEFQLVPQGPAAPSRVRVSADDGGIGASASVMPARG